MCILLLLHRAVADTENLDKPLVSSLSCNGDSVPCSDGRGGGREGHGGDEEEGGEGRHHEVPSVVLLTIQPLSQWHSSLFNLCHSGTLHYSTYITMALFNIPPISQWHSSLFHLCHIGTLAFHLRQGGAQTHPDCPGCLHLGRQTDSLTS